MSGEMRTARQWVAKATNDLLCADNNLRADEVPYDTVCFHCQQFIERLLKALLTRHGIEAPKTHDVRRLIQLAEPFAPELSRLSDASDALTVHGVETRYPGDWREIESTEMNEVVKLAKEFGAILHSALDE